MFSPEENMVIKVKIQSTIIVYLHSCSPIQHVSLIKDHQSLNTKIVEFCENSKYYVSQENIK